MILIPLLGRRPAGQLCRHAADAGQICSTSALLNEIVMTADSAGFPSMVHPESTGIDPVLVDFVVDDPLGRPEQFGRLALISLRAHEGIDDEGPLVGVHETRQGRHRTAFHGLRFHDFPPRLVILK
jgi:hypothetical protein